MTFVRLCKQNVVRTFTTVDHKQPSLKSSKYVYKLNPVVLLLLVGLTGSQTGYWPRLAWLIGCASYSGQNE